MFFTEKRCEHPKRPSQLCTSQLLTQHTTHNMSNSVYNPSVLLKRVFTFSEVSPFILLTDTAAQTSATVVNEFVHQSKTTTNDSINIIFVAFVGIRKPLWANHFISVDTDPQFALNKLSDQIKSAISSPNSSKPSQRSIIIIDSLNEINRFHLQSFIQNIMHSNVSILATYHRDIPDHPTEQNSHLSNYPTALNLLKFMATTILNIDPCLNARNAFSNLSELHTKLDTLQIPRGLNNNLLQIELINRRKSGRSLRYNFQIDTNTHSYNLVNGKDNTGNDIENGASLESTDLLQGLTTFNLGTSTKQKLAKDQVDLPFLEAQKFGAGGAIVYQYEKDDDYDEEDPYEEPF